MSSAHPGLVETRHTLPDGERQVAEMVLDNLFKQLVSAAGSERDRYDSMLELGHPRRKA